MSKIIHGDCLDELHDIEDNSIDAVVTDPPYGLAFMGKSWDKFSPKEFQEFSQEWGEQALRVLKPGGYLLAFCGTRTYHRMVVGLEDAGFTIKDQIDWLYGCLSEDTEILTFEGWKGIDEISKDDKVFSFDYETQKTRIGRVSTSNVKHIFEYDHIGKMVHIKNDNTDQLLTKNHKVLCKTENRKQVDGKRKKYWVNEDYRYVDAGLMRKASRIKLPLSAKYDGEESLGNGLFAELIGLVLSEGWYQSDAVNISQTDTNQEIVGRINYILGKLNANYSIYKRSRKYNGKKYKEYQWYITGDLANKIQKVIPDKKPTNMLLHLPLKEKEFLFKGLMEGDGSKDRNGNYTTFYQNDIDFLKWFQTLCHLMGKQGRINRKKMCVAVHNNSMTEIQGKHRVDDRVSYNGRVWCIETEIGNFFARRNGRIFITGNSGFPKSHDISKAIEGVLGEQSQGFSNAGDDGRDAKLKQDKSFRSDYGYEWKPSDEKAKKWQGWGTALKPAHEAIVVAQKPRDGTYAENVLKHGVGGLNIDGCRIGIEERKNQQKDTSAWHGNNWSAKPQNSVDEYKIVKGRWPPNVILDPKSSQLLDRQSGHLESGKLKKGHPYGKGDGQNVYGELMGKTQMETYGDEGGASRFYYSAKAHKSERNAGLEDLEGGKNFGEYGLTGDEDIEEIAKQGGAITKRYIYCEKCGGDFTQKDGGGRDKTCNCKMPDYEWKSDPRKTKNDIATLKPINLMRYLCRLVTPEDGTVLDPFAGSGTTGCACEIEGFDYILIEKRERFAKTIAPKRIEYWSKSKNWKELKEHEELPQVEGMQNQNILDFVEGERDE